MVLSEAWALAWKSSNMKGFTLTLFGAGIIFAVLSYLSSIGTLPASWHIFVGDFSAEVRTNSLYSLGAILIFLIIFVFSVVYVPAKVDLGLNKKLALLESKNKSKTVKTDKIKFEPKEEQPRSTNGEYYAYLAVKNGENNDLRDCYATLNKLYIKDSSDWLNITEQINPNHSHLTWPDFERNDEKIIRRKNASRINIAKIIPNNIAFIFEKGDISAFFSINTYYLEVEVNGLLNGKPIDSIVFRGFLHHVAKLIQEENRPPLPYFRLFIEPGEIEENKVHA